MLSKYEIFVETSIRFSIQVFGWMLTTDHEIYARYDRSFLNVTLSSFIKDFETYNLCQGLTIPDPKAMLTVKKRCIPKKFSFHNYNEQSDPRFGKQLTFLNILI